MKPHGRIAGIIKAPLHVLGSLPFAAVSLVAPSIGDVYLAWRQDAEDDDVKGGRDTVEKARIDLASQTALVRGVLAVHRKLGWRG